MRHLLCVQVSTDDSPASSVTVYWQHGLILPTCLCLSANLLVWRQKKMIGILWEALVKTGLLRSLRTTLNTDIHELNKILKYLLLKREHDECSDHSPCNLWHSNQILSSISDPNLNINTFKWDPIQTRLLALDWCHPKYILFGPQQLRCGASRLPAGEKTSWEQTNILFKELWKDEDMLLIQESKGYLYWCQLNTALRLGREG